MAGRFRRKLLCMTIFACSIYGFLAVFKIRGFIFTSSFDFESEDYTTVAGVNIDVTSHKVNKSVGIKKSVKKDGEYQSGLSLTVIVGSMRGGTTFTADVINNYPNTFYVFEPLQSVSVRLGNNQTVLYMNGTTSYYPPGEERDRVKAEMIRNWLTCNMENVDLGAMTHSHMLFHSKRLAKHYHCQKSVRSERDKIRTKCLPWLRAQCLNGKARTIKVITMSMRASKILLNILPEVKLIYVFRDPRAVINSQFKSGLVDPRLVHKYSKHFCELLLDDIAETENFTADEQNRLQLVMYEHLADDPLVKSELLYKFAGLHFGKSARTFVKSISMKKGRLNPCPWCSNKGDSKMASLEWRKKISYDKFKVIQENCKPVLEKLGYIMFDTEKNLRNTNIPSVKTVEFTKNLL